MQYCKSKLVKISCQYLYLTITIFDLPQDSEKSVHHEENLELQVN